MDRCPSLPQSHSPPSHSAAELCGWSWGPPPQLSMLPFRTQTWGGSARLNRCVWPCLCTESLGVPRHQAQGLASPRVRDGPPGGTTPYCSWARPSATTVGPQRCSGNREWCPVLCTWRPSAATAAPPAQAGALPHTLTQLRQLGHMAPQYYEPTFK